MSTRRDLLKIGAAAVTIPAARAQHQHGDSPLVQIAKPYTPKILKPDQMEWVAKLVDLIIPRSDTPGASDDGVPVFIDRVLKRDGARRKAYVDGIERLDSAAKKKFKAPFRGLNAAQQTELLT